MKLLVIFCAVGLAVGSHVGTVTTQYHAQDELGQYSYGYAGGPSAKHETKTADGVTRGGYSYLDGHGLVQSAAYVSDSHNGFRVAATNLPVGPAVPAAPVAVAPAPAVVAAAPAVVAARTVVAGPAAYAGSVLAGPATYAGSVLAAPGLLASPLLHSAPAVVATAPGVTATRVLTPVSDTVTVQTHGHGLYHGIHRRSVAWAPHGHAYSAYNVAGLAGGLWAGHGLVAPLAHGPAYVGPLAHGLGDTLAVPGHDTPAVSAAKAAHAVAHATTAARDVTNAHLAGRWGVYAAGAPVVGAWGAAPLAHGPAYVGPLAHGLGDTLAVPGHDTPAVSAARAAHAVAHATTAARDVTNAHLAGSWGVYAAGAPLVGAWGAAPLAHGHVVDTPAVAAAKVAHAAAHAHARAGLVHAHGVYGAHVAHLKKRSVGWPLAVASPLSYTSHAIAAPVALAAAPVAVASSAQYHAQDELGQYNYGYADANSAKSEVRAHDGSTHGSYSYVDGDGLLQSVRYSADAHNGFRVAATNLPAAPVAHLLG